MDFSLRLVIINEGLCVVCSLLLDSNALIRSLMHFKGAELVSPFSLLLSDKYDVESFELPESMQELFFSLVLFCFAEKLWLEYEGEVRVTPLAVDMLACEVV